MEECDKYRIPQKGIALTRPAACSIIKLYISEAYSRTRDMVWSTVIVGLMTESKYKNSQLTNKRLAVSRRNSVKTEVY